MNDKQNPYQSPGQAGGNSKPQQRSEFFVILIWVLLAPAVIVAFCTTCTVTGMFTFQFLGDIAIILGVIFGSIAAFFTGKTLLGLLKPRKKFKLGGKDVATENEQADRSESPRDDSLPS